MGLLLYRHTEHHLRPLHPQRHQYQEAKVSNKEELTQWILVHTPSHQTAVYPKPLVLAEESQSMIHDGNLQMNRYSQNLEILLVGPRNTGLVVEVVFRWI